MQKAQWPATRLLYLFPVRVQPLPIIGTLLVAQHLKRVSSMPAVDTDDSLNDNPEDPVQHPKLTGRFSEGSGYDATSQPRR